MPLTDELEKKYENRVAINNPATSNDGTDLSESSSEPYGIYLSSTEHWDARDCDFIKGWFNHSDNRLTYIIVAVRVLRLFVAITVDFFEIFEFNKVPYFDKVFTIFNFKKNERT